MTHSCKTVHPIQNIIDNVVQLTWFVCASANRKNILKEAMANDSDLLQQIIEVSEEYDFSGKLLQNAGNYYKMPEISSLSNLLVRHDGQPELTHYLRLYLIIQISITR